MNHDVEMASTKSGLPTSSAGSADLIFTHNHEVESTLHDTDSHSLARSHGSSTTEGEHEKKDDPEAPRPLPRQSTEIGLPIVVPRLKRRGLLGQVTLVAEIENPKAYSRPMKWFITFIVSLAGTLAPLGTSIFFRKSFPIDLCF